MNHHDDNPDTFPTRSDDGDFDAIEASVPAPREEAAGPTADVPFEAEAPADEGSDEASASAAGDESIQLSEPVAPPSRYGPGVDIAAVSSTTLRPGQESAGVTDRIDALQSRIAELESQRRRPSTLAILAAVVVTLVAAFAIGRITASDDDSDDVAAAVTLPVSSSTSAAPTTAAPAPTTAAPTTTSTTSTPDTTAVPSTLLPGGSTVADIAAAVGPGVVQIETSAGLGSGVIYDAEGFILTAAHVVDIADDFVTVRLADGRAFDGEIVGTHTPTDVAVIKIDPVDGLTVIELAPADSLEIGELAVALGSPFGLEQTVTAGIVSAVDRIVDGVVMVQTDAAINPGNSGGPLVDEFGRVIGINDQIFTRSGGNEGIGFAISIELAILIAEQIVDGDDIQLAVLGVTVSPGDGDPPGALVQSVVGGSAAEAAGIEEGDLIVEADGRLIINSDALRARVIKKSPGDALELKILRDGEIISMSAVLGATDA